MTELIIGPAGSGKTTAVIERILSDLSLGKKVVLLVPEQSAVTVEGAVTQAAQERGIPQSELEILNFRRLCNRIFREYGGLAYHSVTHGAKALLLWEALFAMAAHLKHFKTEIEDAERFIPHLLSTIGEFKAYGITPAQLEEASAEIAEEDAKLSDKLYDLSLLYAEYQRLLGSTHSDPSDDLTRLGEMLKTHAFFSDIALYLDGFRGFTPQEYRVLSVMFRQAASVTVTFCYREDDSIAFESKGEEYRKLRSLLSFDDLTVTPMTTCYRFSDPALTFLEQELWSMSSEKRYQGRTEAVRTVLAENRYEEAEFVACDILRRIEEGAKFREIAIVTGHIEDYRGILDSIFERHRIPCHMSRKISLSEKPLFKLVLSALAIKNHGWHIDDVIVFLKTGLTPLTPEACDELESYAYCWNIVGRRWYDSDDWFMNPDGYTDMLTEESKALLCRVNASRRLFVPPLTKLHESLDGTRTVKEICEAVYTFVCELGVSQRISTLGSDDDIRLYNCFSDVLDTLVDMLGTRKADAGLFSALFSLVVKQTDVGNLPSSMNEVAVGSASLFRADQIKHIYLLGANEGSFPAVCEENALFTDAEKACLEAYGVTLSPNSSDATVGELFSFYSAACGASESVTVLCCAADMDHKPLKPSIGFERFCVLYPENQTIRAASLSPDFKIRTKETALELLAPLSHTAEGEALRRLYREDETYAALLDREGQPLVTTEETIDTQTAGMLFGKDISLTQSRLDSYVKCAFGYQCEYVLKLKETKRAEFVASDTGTLVHAILEKFFAEALDENGRLAPISEEEIDPKIDLILESYLATIYGTDKDKQLTPRAMQLFVRLRRTVRLLVRNLLHEFAQSDFVPRFFEMPINTSDEADTVSSLAIPLPDGTNAYIYGIADRVDICKQGKDVYVRVVDYKTGHKDFSLEDIGLGLNLQMLLYLFSIWKDKTGTFRKAVGCEGDIIPAGVLYCSAKTEGVSAEPSMSEAEIYGLVADTFKRKGMLLNDEAVLRMMEHNLSGKYIPVTLTSKSKIRSSASLATLAEFGALLNEISATVARLATAMKQGVASCEPLKSGKNDGCQYCAYHDICRNPKAFVPAERY